MTIVANITLRNFLSVGAVTQSIRLDQHGLTLILGSNTDANGGITRNGAGKTTILQAVSFGLFGKPLTRIKVDNLVNNINPKGMLVTISFVRDGKTYRIERGRKPQILRFFVNDKEQTYEEDIAQGENRHTQVEIERVLGMTHTMFSHIVALNTFTEPFLKMKVSDQRIVIEELLGVTQLSQRADTLKKLVAQTKEAVREKEAHLRGLEEANERIGTAIKKGERDRDAWALRHEQKLGEIAAGISDMEGMDFDAEIAAFDALDIFRDKERDLRLAVERAVAQSGQIRAEGEGYAREFKHLQAASAAIDPAGQIARYTADIARKEDDIERHEIQLAKLTEELQGIEHDLTHTDDHTCRSCGQGLSGTDHLTSVIANLEKLKKAHLTKIAREEKGRADRQSEIEAIRLEAVDIETRAATEREDLSTKITAMIEKIGIAEDRLRGALEVEAAERTNLSGLGERPQTLFQTRDEAYKAKALYDTLARDLEQEMHRENPFETQIATLTSTLVKIDYVPLTELQDLQKHQDLLLKLLTNKDSFIRKKIIDQNLTYLNTRLNSYIDKLGLPHEVKFQPDLSVEITHLGRDFDFEQLSRGEMNRVIMSTSWAFRDVWESLNEPVNLYFVDEVLDQGTDSQGAEAALGILKGMSRDRGKNVFLISHRDELIGQIDHTLLVRKQDGFSQFEEDVTS